VCVGGDSKKKAITRNSIYSMHKTVFLEKKVKTKPSLLFAILSPVSEFCRKLLTSMKTKFSVEI
jgi:hypothetical protein